MKKIIQLSIILIQLSNLLQIGPNNIICLLQNRTQLSCQQNDEIILAKDISRLQEFDDEYLKDDVLSIGVDKICFIQLTFDVQCYQQNINSNEEQIGINKNGHVQSYVSGLDFYCQGYLPFNGYSQNISCVGNTSITDNMPNVFLNQNKNAYKKLQSSNRNVCIKSEVKISDNLQDVHINCWGDHSTKLSNVTQKPLQFDRRNNNSAEIDNQQVFAMGNDTACIFFQINKSYGSNCWGLCTGDICTIPEEIYFPYSLVIGHNHACAYQSFKLQCWGNNTYGQTTIPWEFQYGLISIVAGESISCGLKSYPIKSSHKFSRVECWGNEPPSFEELKNNVQRVSLGGRHTCVVKEGWQECWGNNDQGQLEVGHPQYFSLLEDFDFTMNIIDVSAGWDFTCYTSLGQAKDLNCIGFNYIGQTDIPNQLSHYTNINSGLSHSCALSHRKDRIKCWGGQNEYEQLINLEFNPQYKISHLSIGDDFTCFSYDIEETKTLECKGNNSHGQVNSQVGPLYLAFHLAAGGVHACITIGTRVSCWGSNLHGQTSVPSWFQVDQTSDIEALSAGDAHTCGIGKWQNVQCWGLVRFHQTDKVKMLKGINTNQENFCTIDQQQQARCFGDNEWGQIDLVRQGNQNLYSNHIE